MKKILLLLVMSFLIFNSCNKDDDNPITPPSQTVPTLSSPSDGATDVAFPITLTWNAFAGATSYTLQVSVDSAFTICVFNQSGLKSTNQQINGLSDSTTYYWRVIASNTFGASNPSNTWSFTTNDGRPGVPTLVFPTEGAIQSTVPTLKWNVSDGATSYTLQISVSNSFTSYVYNQSGLTGIIMKVNGLSNSTKYYWRVSASNSYGNSNPSIPWSFTTVGVSFCGSTATVNYAGKTYNTVQIGNQCWFKENLDVGVYVASINTGSTHSEMSNNGIIEKYCYENNESNCDTFGGLYDWNEAMGYVTTEGTQGICPAGWHIPTLAEFEELIFAVNNDANALKSIGEGSGSGAGTNTSGFSALLAGCRIYDGNFNWLGYNAYFWSSTVLNSNMAYHLHLFNNEGYIYQNGNHKEDGFSVRCVKN